MMMVRYFSFAFAVAGMAVMAVSAAQASEGEGAAKAGLPQLDTSFYAGQLFWLAVSFGLLYLLMSKVALPAIRRTQESRSTVIQGELEAATKANEDARAMTAQGEKALAEARTKAQATVSAIMATAAKDAAVRDQAQQQDMARRLVEAESRIRKVRDEALADCVAPARDLAQAIISKVVG